MHYWRHMRTKTKKRPQIKNSDPAGIKYFCDLLERTQVMMQGFQLFGNLNSLDTMTKLIMKLPFDLRRKWIKQSVFIKNQTGRVAQFNDFVDFVKARSEEFIVLTAHLFRRKVCYPK